MAAPFLAGAMTAHLLTEDKKPNIIHNTYVPLSEEQADLYMTTQEYVNQLDTNCKSIFLYIDRNSYYQPRPLVHRSTGERRKITIEQAYVLIEDEKTTRQKSDKTSLMTRGIGGLEKGTIPREEDLCNRIGTYILCFPCRPCSIINDCISDAPELENGRDGEAKVDQYHFNLIKV